MNPLKFQVDVEKATPACSADCPNLQIDVKDLNYVTDSRDGFSKMRKIRCVNDSYCQNLYRAFKEERDEL